MFGGSVGNPVRVREQLEVAEVQRTQTQPESFVDTYALITAQLIKRRWQLTLTHTRNNTNARISHSLAAQQCLYKRSVNYTRMFRQSQQCSRHS